MNLSRTDVNLWENTTLTCTFPRYGDLMSEVYLVFDLPEIVVPNTLHTMKWVKRLGESIIADCRLMIACCKADQYSGHWLNVWNQLSMDNSKLNVYNRMIGHTVDMYDPDLLKAFVKVGDTFIQGRKIVVPLVFWFNKSIGTAIPLTSLQYHEVMLVLELRPFQDLYMVNVNDGNQAYVKPKQTDTRHHLRNFVRVNVETNTVSISPYLEVNYVFLDDPERHKFMTQPLDYLIDQVVQSEHTIAAAGLHHIDLTLQNPVKEIIWVMKPTGYRETNDWSEYLNDQHLQHARILFNGKSRI